MELTDNGYFDEVVDGSAKGWAVNPANQDDPVTIDVVIDGEFVGETIADLFREDLLQQKIRDGYAGFSFRIPIRYFDGKPHTIDLVQRELKRALPDSPREFTWSVQDLPILKEKTAWAERELVVRHSPRANEMWPRVLRMKRLAIMSTSHGAPRFLSYHRELVHALSAFGFVVHIIHSGGEPSAALSSIESDNVFLTLKRNIGYDFNAWAVGIYTNCALLPHLDELLLLNDSIVGPITDLAPLLERIRAANTDVVGLTDSFERCYHLQSYFLWFGRAICQSPALQLFIAQYSLCSDKEIVIREGDVSLTRYLINAGFTMKALFPYEAVAGAWLAAVPELLAGVAALPVPEQPGTNGGYKESLRARVDAIVAQVIEGIPVDPTHFFWDTLITRMGFPFLKHDMLFVNPSGVPSYYRVSDVLQRAPERIRDNIAELRRVYGGSKTPFLMARPERAVTPEAANAAGALHGAMPQHDVPERPYEISPRRLAIERVVAAR